MGVGISAHRLAGSVARLGGMGTIASVDLRRHHPDLMERSGRGRDKAVINEVNLIALDREVRRPGRSPAGRDDRRQRDAGRVGIAAFVRQACESGAEAIVMGAGLPLDLPDLTAELSRRGADPDPLRRPRDQRRAQEVGPEEPPARRDRDRAPVLRRRPPGCDPAGRPGRSAVRLRGGHSRRARALPDAWASSPGASR